MAAAVANHQFPKMDKFFNTTREFEHFLINKLFQTPIHTTPTKLVIPLFTIVVGSNMSQGDLTSPESPYYRNHEYPQFCRKLFEDPLTQISPQMMDYITRFEMLDFRQYIILIDPFYTPSIANADNGILHGLKKYFPSLSFPVEHNLTFQHNDSQITAVSSLLDVFIVTDSVTANDIYNYLSIIESHNEIMYTDYLVNILDCTSHLLRDFWVNNSNNKIWISIPECMLLDSQLKYNPILTITEPKLLPTTSVKRHRMESNITLRWVSYEEDHAELPNLESIIDIAEHIAHKSNILNMYDFLKDDMKTNLLQNNILALVKLISLDTYTLMFKLEDSTEFKLSKITYKKFSNLWCNNKLFSNRVLDLIDPYFKSNIVKFTKKFLATLEKRRLDDTVTMLQLYQEEIDAIFKQLNTVFPDDFKDTPILYPVSRSFIYDYLRKHHIVL
jgi:hypothetical protein